jgi:hypothetical protein
MLYAPEATRCGMMVPNSSFTSVTSVHILDGNIPRKLFLKPFHISPWTLELVHFLWFITTLSVSESVQRLMLWVIGP